MDRDNEPAVDYTELVIWLKEVVLLDDPGFTGLVHKVLDDCHDYNSLRILLRIIYRVGWLRREGKPTRVIKTEEDNG